MSKVDDYRQQLRSLSDWDAYLRQESGLPGPRGNLDLAHAAALEGTAAQFERWAALDAAQAPTNDPGEFLAFCGVLGMGRLVADGQRGYLPAVRAHASDPRWRLREAVAMGMQLWGVVDMPALLAEMARWAEGNPLEQRAAAAALCEPALLHDPAHTRAVLHILDRITASIVQQAERKSEDFKALHKGLGYCWSVAAAALPEDGLPLLEKWLAEPDKDIRWIMTENLKKKRLERVDAAWVQRWLAALGK